MNGAHGPFAFRNIISKADLYKWVFKSFLNLPMVLLILILIGRLFQIVGAAVSKVLSPPVGSGLALVVIIALD